MAQQTAINWLIEQIRNPQNQKALTGAQWMEVIERARRMEREQIEECWNTAHQAGRFEGKGIAEENWQTFEQYYNETYGE